MLDKEISDQAAKSAKPKDTNAQIVDFGNGLVLTESYGEHWLHFTHEDKVASVRLDTITRSGYIKSVITSWGEEVIKNQCS